MVVEIGNAGQLFNCLYLWLIISRNIDNFKSLDDDNNIKETIWLYFNIKNRNKFQMQKYFILKKYGIIWHLLISNVFQTLVIFFGTQYSTADDLNCFLLVID